MQSSAGFAIARSLAEERGSAWVAREQRMTWRGVVQVNYVGKAANLYEDAGFELHGSVHVIGKHLGMTHIWDRVRVMGGAYGGFCSFDSHSGLFTFLSYRCGLARASFAAGKFRLRPPALVTVAGPVLDSRVSCRSRRERRQCSPAQPRRPDCAPVARVRVPAAALRHLHASLALRRDPNLLSTLAAYDESVPYLRNIELDEHALTKAIIGTIGDIDSYQLPDAKGSTAFMRHLLGVTDEERQTRRDEILATRPDDFRRFADVLEAALAAGGRVAAVTSAGALEKARADQPGCFEHEISVL